MTDAAKAVKAKAIITPVTMEDGSTVNFSGNRKMLKSYAVEGSTIVARFDFINGAVRTFKAPHDILLQLAGHGAVQKVGDTTVNADSVEDMVLDVEDVIQRLENSEWAAKREAGDGFGGASFVIRAIATVNGKSVETVKAFLQKKLDTAKANGQKLTRQQLYASFKRPGSQTGELILKWEAEKAAKAKPKQGELELSADELMSEMNEE